MSMLSTEHYRNIVKLSGAFSTALLIFISGCASTPTEVDEPLTIMDERSEQVSRHAAAREAAMAAASDTDYVPPVPPSSPAMQGAAQRASNDYFRGLQAMMAKNYDRALDIFQQMEETFPGLSGPIINTGIIQLRNEDYEQAENTFRRALDTNDLNPYAHNALAVALREQGHFTEAREQYLKAIDLDPAYARAHFNLAVLAELYLLDLETALKHFREYQDLQRQPDDTVSNWIFDLERRIP